MKNRVPKGTDVHKPTPIDLEEYCQLDANSGFGDGEVTMPDEELRERIAVGRSKRGSWQFDQGPSQK